MRSFQNLFKLDPPNKRDLIDITYIGNKFMCFIPIVPYGFDVIDENDLEMLVMDSVALRFAYSYNNAIILVFDQLKDNDLELMIYECCLEHFDEHVIVVYSF